MNRSATSHCETSHRALFACFSASTRNLTGNATGDKVRAAIATLTKLGILCLLAVGLLGGSRAHARSAVTFNGVRTTAAEYPTYNNLVGLALDGSGNVYVSNGQFVYQISPSCSASGNVSTCEVALGGSFYGVAAEAVDGKGNVYVAVTDQGIVWEIPASCIAGSNNSSCVYQLGADLRNPTGMVVDSSGNLYISDSGYQTMIEISANCIAAESTSSSCDKPLGGGFSQPKGVAVDSSGSVYVADFGNEAVKEIPTSCIATGNNAACVKTLGGGFSEPAGLVADSSGDIFVADQSSPLLEEIPASCIAGANNASCVITVGVAMLRPTSVVLGGNGTFYVTDTLGPPAFIYEMQLQSVNLGSQAVGSASAASSLNFTVGAGTIGSVAVLTTGSPNLDFANAAGTTCNSTTNGACVVNVTFTPAVPGLRVGAVVFYSGANNTGAVLASVPVYGVGTGPQAVLYPGTQSTVGGVGSSPFALKTPYGMTVDSVGNVYIADNNHNRVLKVPPTDPTCATSCTTIGTGLSLPITVAVDGAGNLYIADEGNSRVVEVPPTDRACATSCTTIGTGLSRPYGVAVDGSGNLYIADFGNSQVLKETPSGGGSYTQSVLFNSSSNGLNNNFRPISVAVDGSSNLYIADHGNSQVLKETFTAGGYTQSVVANSSSNGLSGPQGVGVDGSGNLYIADTNNNRVLLEMLSGGSYTQSVIVTQDVPNNSGLSSPTGVSVDGNGNVYIADYNNNMVLKLDGADPQTVSFATPTAVGSTDTTDGAQTLTLENIGNAPLTFPVPASGGNPSIAPGFTLATGGNTACQVVNAGGSPQTLAPSASCLLPISFVPASAGNISGSLILTDNNLNMVNATQTIALSGIGLPVQAFGAMSFSPSSTVTYGSSQTITISDIVTYGGTRPTGAVVFVINGVSHTASCTTTGSPETCSVVVPAGTIAALSATGYSVTVSAAADSNYAAVTGARGTLTIAKAPLTVTVKPVSSVYGVAFPTFTGTLTGVVTGDGITATYATTATPTSAPGGVYSITATLVDPNTKLGNYTVTNTPATLTITKAGPSITLVSSLNPVLLQNSITLTATLTGATNPTGSVIFTDITTNPAVTLGSGTLVNGVATLTTSTLTFGTHFITATYSGDTNFGAVTSTQLAESVVNFSLGISTTGGSNSVTTATIQPGGTAVFLLPIGPSVVGGTFPATITLTASGLPPGATYTFSPATLPAGSGWTEVTFTVKMPAISMNVVPESPSPTRKYMPLALGLLLLPFAGKLRKASKRVRILSLVLFMMMGLAAAVGLSGCTSSGQAGQTYTITVTGTAGNLSNSTTVTLTVE